MGKEFSLVGIYSIVLKGIKKTQIKSMETIVFIFIQIMI